VSKIYWAIAIFLFISAGAAIWYLNQTLGFDEPIYIEINAPFEQDIEPILVPTTSPDKIWTKNFKVKYGDSFTKIMKRLSLPQTKINLLNNQILSIFHLRDFKVGIPYQVEYTHDFNPRKMVFEIDPLHYLQVNFITDNVIIYEREIERKDILITSPIRSSLVSTVLKFNAPEKLADQILSILAWKVDFRNLLKGDQVEVLYEALIVDSQVVDIQRVKFIHFKHDENWFHAYGFDAGNGWEYFDENGQNLNHAPLIFDRITSLYAQRRFHPIRRRWKAHYGMDFEAEEGTPVEAILDGVVTRVRYDRANGNNVKIQHSEDLSTQYLHFSKIAPDLQAGDSVRRGDVIGLVGTTGWSSGPHLCLRVWHNGYQKDPLQFDFPRREDIPENLMDEFLEVVKNSSAAIYH